MTVIAGCSARAPSGTSRRCTSNHLDEIASSHCLPRGLGARQLCDYRRHLRPAEWVSGVRHGSNLEPVMSALGQKRTFGPLIAMSALPPKADIRRRYCDVRFVPKADSCAAANDDDYSITSSAWASMAGGTVRPSAFAVLRLMTNSNLVDCCTGRFAGCSPLRMRSTYSAAS
jgi:hypothetical protein